MSASPRIGVASLLVACVASMAALAAAQEYPAKPVRFVTGGPGSMMNIVARQVAQRLGEQWGRAIVVESRTGPGISGMHVSQATPDGYTLLVADSTQLAVRPILSKSLQYDPAVDLAPVALMATSPNLLVAHASLPAASLPEFLSYAKGQPQGIEFANGGPATNSHLAGELFRQLTGINVLHVNYKGGGAALTATLSGEAKATFSLIFLSLPHVTNGKLRAYAITGEQRFAGAPEIPTMAEAGAGELVTSYWFGILAPARTPNALVAKINRDVGKVLQSAEMKATLLERGAEPQAGTPDKFGAFWHSETQRFRKLIETAGIRIE